MIIIMRSVARIASSATRQPIRGSSGKSSGANVMSQPSSITALRFRRVCTQLSSVNLLSPGGIHIRSTVGVPLPAHEVLGIIERMTRGRYRHFMGQRLEIPVVMKIHRIMGLDGELRASGSRPRLSRAAGGSSPFVIAGGGVIGTVCRGDNFPAQHAQECGEPCPRALLRDEVAVALDPQILGQ